MARADRQARRAERRAGREAQKADKMALKRERLAARGARQEQRQGFLAGLAPQILDKIPLGGTTGEDLYDAPPSGGGSGTGDGLTKDKKSGNDFDIAKMMPLIIGAVAVMFLMKKK